MLHRCERRSVTTKPLGVTEARALRKAFCAGIAREPAREICPLPRRQDERQHDQHRLHEARYKREHRVQRVQVEIAVPVSLKMYWGPHESPIADSGGSLSSPHHRAESPLSLGSFSP